MIKLAQVDLFGRPHGRIDRPSVYAVSQQIGAAEHRHTAKGGTLLGFRRPDGPALQGPLP